MRLLNVELARTGEGISGGEVCFIEIARRIGAQQINVVPQGDVESYRKYGLPESFLPLEDPMPPSRYGILAVYLGRILSAVRFSRACAVHADAVVSHSEFAPTFVCAMLTARALRRPWVAWLHMLAPHPMLGYRGAFSPTPKPIVPTVSALFYWLNQKVFLLFARKLADRLIVTAAYTRSRLAGQFERRIRLVPYGISAKSPSSAPDKCFDAVFVGRFHAQKGLDYLLEAWRDVVRAKPDAMLAVVGSGTPQIERDVRRRIARLNLQRNVTMLGFLSGERKDDAVARSRVFAFPSTYESFGIVALEAMQLGVPVVGFDLPVYEGVFEAMVRVPFGDCARFAREILRLLDDQQHYRASADAAVRNAARFTWEQSARIYEGVLNELCG